MIVLDRPVVLKPDALGQPVGGRGKQVEDFVPIDRGRVVAGQLDRLCPSGKRV